MQRDHPVSAIALVDASPGCFYRVHWRLSTRPVHKRSASTCSPPVNSAMRPGRLAEILRTEGVDARLPAEGDALKTLEQQLAAAWGGAHTRAPQRRRVLDVAASTGGTTARAVAALEQARSETTTSVGSAKIRAWCGFFRILQRTSSESRIDIGSGVLDMGHAWRVSFRTRAGRTAS